VTGVPGKTIYTWKARGKRNFTWNTCNYTCIYFLNIDFLKMRQKNQAIIFFLQSQIPFIRQQWWKRRSRNR